MPSKTLFSRKQNQDEMDEIDDQTMEDEVNQFKSQVIPEVFASILVTSAVVFVSFYDYLPWKIADGQGQKHISYKNRCVFTLQLAFLDILPLIVCILAVFNRRRQTYAINPIDPRGKPYVECLKGILENTLEQFIIKLVLSFILCTLLRSHELILLPVFTFLFLFGRLTFALGYPTHRSFGMTMNFLSIILVAALIAYRLLYKGILFQYIYWK